MIRQPSNEYDLLWWHRAYMNRERPPISDGIVHCGWFKRRWIKNGPWVPARIFVVSDICPDTGELTCDEEFRIEIEGIDKGDPVDHWSYLKPISEEEFHRLMDMRLRDPRFSDGYQPIDLSERPTPPLEAYLNA